MNAPSEDDSGTRRVPVLRDAEGTPIPLQGRVEQIAVDEEHGALFSRLHQHGEVVGRDTHLLYVCFESDKETVALRGGLVRVLSTDGG